MKYQYDESGLFFYYFLISVIGLLLLPATYAQLKALLASASGVGKISAKTSRCQCEACQKKRQTQAKLEKEKKKSSIPYRKLAIAIGWVLFSVLAYKIATTTFEESIWDPYAILEVDTSTPVDKIKRQYRRMSLKLHPDKVPDDQKVEAEAKFVQLSKAYKVLTDEDARRNWEEFGDPDGRQAMSLGIALPTWLVESTNAFKVLFLYSMVFGVLLPWLVYRWWSKSRQYSRDQILNDTMGSFFRELKEGMNAKAIIEVLSVAREFVDLVPPVPEEQNDVNALITTLNNVLSSKFGEKLDKPRRIQQYPYCFKPYLLIWAHLLRVDIQNPKLQHDQRIVLEKSVQLCGGLLQIASARSWLHVSTNIVDVIQMLSQGIAPFTSSLLQLPGVTPDQLKHFQTKKRNITTLKQLSDINEEEKKGLFRFLDDEGYKLCMDVASKIPKVECTSWKFKVPGEDKVTCNAFVSLILNLKFTFADQSTVAKVEEDKENAAPVTNGKSDEKKEEEKDNKDKEELKEEEDEEDEKDIKWWEPKKDNSIIAHCPYFPTDRKIRFFVFLGLPNNGRLITVQKVDNLGDLDSAADGVLTKQVKIQFQAPPQAGKFRFSVFVKSDCYCGIDWQDDLTMDVLEAPPVEDIPDDISEPDEDSLAGQMAALKREMQGKNDEVSDSEDEEDEEE